MKNVFRVINELVASGVIQTYAIGGAIAATFYTEPFNTADLDIFFPVTVQSSQLYSLEPLYEHLAKLGYHPKDEFVQIEGWDVQFLPAPDPLVDEAVEKAETFEVEGEKVRVLTPEYLVAIALKTGRGKDYARITMFRDLNVVKWPVVRELIKRFGLQQRWLKYQTLK